MHLLALLGLKVALGDCQLSCVQFSVKVSLYDRGLEIFNSMLLVDNP